MRRAYIAAVVVFVGALAAGCGSSSESEKRADAVADAYTAYIAAVKAGDGKTACGLLTPAQRRAAANSVAIGERADLRGASCEKAISQGTLPQLQQVQPNLEEIEVDGDRASGLDPGEGAIGPQRVFFRRSGGQWRISKTIFFR